MDLRGQPHLSSEGDARARNAGGIGLCEGQLEMRGFYGLGYFLAQFRKKLGEDAITSETLAISRFKKLFANDAMAIDKKISRARKALLHPGSFFIQDAIVSNGLGLGVGEQGVFDLVPVGKIFQDGCGVVADRRQLEALLFKLRNGALQLDQLPFAEGSPVGGAIEEKHRAVLALQAVESLHTAKLVGHGKSRSFLPDCQANRHRLD